MLWNCEIKTLISILSHIQLVHHRGKRADLLGFAATSLNVRTNSRTPASLVQRAIQESITLKKPGRAVMDETELDKLKNVATSDSISEKKVQAALLHVLRAKSADVSVRRRYTDK